MQRVARVFPESRTAVLSHDLLHIKQKFGTLVVGLDSSTQRQSTLTTLAAEWRTEVVVHACQVYASHGCQID